MEATIVAKSEKLRSVVYKVLCKRWTHVVFLSDGCISRKSYDVMPPPSILSHGVFQAYHNETTDNKPRPFSVARVNRLGIWCVI